MTADAKLPKAVDSEQIVLSTILYDQRSFAEVRARLSDDEWYLPAHETIWSAICELAEFGAIDFTSVYDTIANSEPRLLPALIALTDKHAPGSLEWHCDRIVATSASRALLRTATRLQQRAEEGAEPIGLAEETIDALRGVQRAGGEDASTVKDFQDVIERVVDPGLFVVPGLLARLNRIVITAPEGYGKSSLLRQIAACAAAGIHPFKTRGRTRPVKALVVDAENPEDINTVEYQRLADGLRELEVWPERGMLTIDECGPINLLDPKAAARLYALVEKVSPELIIIGPVYKLHEEDPNLEGPARKLSAVLDRLLRISGAALVLEAHTPHNDGPQGQLLRPFGASLWKRWPDFGYCLHPVTVPKRNSEPTEEERLSMQMRESYFSSWRGSRAMRDWPARLCIGASGLPWGSY